MPTPDLIHTSGVTIQTAPALPRATDSGAEADLAHILSTDKSTVQGAADLSWISEEHSRLLEG